MANILDRFNPFKRAAPPSPLKHSDVARRARRSADLSNLAALRNSGLGMASTRQDNTTGAWESMPLTADQVIIRNWDVLVARSREQAMNNDYMKRFLALCGQNIVGHTGIMLQPQVIDAKGKHDDVANDALSAEWAVWNKPNNCSVSGKLSWRAVLKAAVLSAAKDGEFFLQKVYGPDAGPYGFALHLIDPVRCPVNYNIGNMGNGDRIACGIRFNQAGRPKSYFFYDEDSGGIGSYSYASRPLREIPAEDIIHGFKVDMLEQKRGLPWAGVGLYRMRQLTGFEEASVVNARVSAAKGGVVEWENGFGPELDEDDVLTVEREPGDVQVLPEGARWKDTNPTYPAQEFAVFHKAMLRGISAGMGVAYNNLAQDLEHVNFSSIRQGALDERDHWKEEQEWLIETLVQPVYEAWLRHALLSGRILAAGKPLKAERIDKYSKVAWQGRRWSWIDPQAETNANVAALENLLTTPSSIIREQGRDPSEVWREFASDIAAMAKAMEAAGLPKELAYSLFAEKMKALTAPPAER